MQFNPYALIDARTKAGMSRRKLARVAAISASTLTNLEEGKVKGPNNATLSRIAEALNLDWSYFFDQSVQKIGRSA